MPHGPAEILLIDGSPDARREIVAPLNGRGYRVTHRQDARSGLEEIYRRAPEMIVIRRDLPDMDGLHFCAELKNDIILRHVPVILLDAEGLLEDEIFAGESGAEDYLTGPLDLDELDGRIRHIFQMGTLGINYHPVSGLPGNNSAYRRIQETLDRESPFAICFMDLRGLRRFNEQFGYEQGDRILSDTARLVSRVLQSHQRCLDFFGHLSSNKFVLVTQPEGVENLCSEIVEQFEWKMPELFDSLRPKPDPQSLFAEGAVPLEGLRERVFLSVAILTREEKSPRHAARIIDQGMELLAHAKQEQKSRWVRQRTTPRAPVHPLAAGAVVLEESTGLLSGRYQKRPNGKLSAHVGMFREILSEQAIDMYFQPIVYVESGELFGYEALLRGPRDTHFESPVILFGMARRLDMEPELDLLCLKKLHAAVAAQGNLGDPKIFFNLCPESFFSPRFQEAWDALAGELDPSRMVLEVTRKRRIREFSCFRSAIENYRKRGFQVAIDDAKAGTLSLRTILELVPDYVKIDISIIRNIHRDASRQKLFRQFHSFCRRRSVTLISEGVEQRRERDFLLENGAELAQGFFYALPQPPSAPPPHHA